MAGADCTYIGRFLRAAARLRAIAWFTPEDEDFFFTPDWDDDEVA